MYNIPEKSHNYNLSQRSKQQKQTTTKKKTDPRASLLLLHIFIDSDMLGQILLQK